ncbi:MAG: hypothetical protein HUK21_00640 [Fibrobacteraceae bacterium]|nr:hypothetical protein [Fibrobacteraceae bacterium]
MHKITILTYVLRLLGLVLILLALFGGGVLYNLFPGLEGQSTNPFFYGGVVLYMLGAVAYYFISRREKALKRKAKAEEVLNRFKKPEEGESQE